MGGAGGGSLSSPTPPARPSAVLGTVNIDPPLINSSVVDSSATALPERKIEVPQKLHSSVLAVVERLKKRQAIPTGEEYKFIRHGKAEVQVWLTDKSAATIAQLKALGFEVVLDPKSSKLVIGRVSIRKLEALAALKFVRYVAPQTFK